MLSFKFILFYITSVAALPSLNAKRQLVPASTIIQDIQNIDDGVNNLSAFLRTYQGGTLQSTPLTVDVAAIHTANRKGYADANLASQYNSADSNAIITFTTNTVGNDIPSGVDLLVKKKPLFDAAGLDPTILAGLKLLLNDHDTFSQALATKISADAVPAGTAVIVKIHNAIQSGINAYSA